MKKLGLAVAVASALGAASSAVQAYGIGMYANGLLVPYANVAAGTVVGLMTCAAGNVKWYFMDKNSNHVTDGSIPMTKNDYHSFIWNDATAGNGLSDKPGYLVFVLDTNGAYNQATDKDTAPDGKLLPEDKDRSGDIPCLAGNAFQVDLPNDDIVFQPTVPLAIHDFIHFDLDILPPGIELGIGIPNLATLENNSQFFMVWGAWAGELLSMRYYVDYQDGGNDTTVYHWSVCKPREDMKATAYDDKQTPKSITIPMPNEELNWFDVEKIEGMPTTFTDGYINTIVDFAIRPNLEPDTAYCDYVNPRGWGNPPETPIGDSPTQYWPIDLLPNLGGIQSVVSWSVVHADSFGATQTLINPHLWDHFWIFDALEYIKAAP
jgi:hypothetical protein